MKNITITHKIENAKAYSTDVLQNVVKSVVFVIEATDGTRVKTSFFPVELDAPDTKTFVEYEQLSRQQILDWVLAKVDPAQIQALEEGLTAVLLQSTADNKVVVRPIELPNE